MEKSEFIAMVEEITGARVTDHTNRSLPSSSRPIVVPHNSIEFDGEHTIVGGVLSMSGSADDYRYALGGLPSVVSAGTVVYLNAFRSWGEGEEKVQSAVGHKIDFLITLPVE